MSSCGAPLSRDESGTCHATCHAAPERPKRMANELIAATLFMAGSVLGWLLRAWLAAAEARALRARIEELARLLAEERREVAAAREDHKRLAERLRREESRKHAPGACCAL